MGLELHFCICPVALVWSVKYLVWQRVRFGFLTKWKLRIYSFLTVQAKVMLLLFSPHLFHFVPTQSKENFKIKKM